MESGGHKLLIVPSTEDVVAYDPRTGKELWRAEGLGGNVVHTPVAGHGMVYVSTGYPTKKTMGIRLDPAPGEARVAWKYEKGTGYIRETLRILESLNLPKDKLEKIYFKNLENLTGAKLVK